MRHSSAVLIVASYDCSTSKVATVLSRTLVGHASLRWTGLILISFSTDRLHRKVTA